MRLSSELDSGATSAKGFAQMATGFDDARVRLAALESPDSAQDELARTLAAIDASSEHVGMLADAVRSGDADRIVPRPSSSVLALWSIQELTPWLLAAIVLALLIPILRAAEPGDPFWEGATRRLATIGVLLLVGIPAIAVLQYVAAEATSEGSFVAPMVEPTLSLSLVDVLPGVLTLALAGVFRRGVELRDLGRHTI